MALALESVTVSRQEPARTKDQEGIEEEVGGEGGRRRWEEVGGEGGKRRKWEEKVGGGEGGGRRWEEEKVGGEGGKRRDTAEMSLNYVD